MGRLKRFVLSLILILIMIGACGCMNAEQEYVASIQNYLEGKYNCGFTVHNVNEGFSGSDGNYIHASCESEEYAGKVFDVYCYPIGGDKTGDEISVSGESYVIYEKYAEVYFANQMRSEVEALLPENVFVECKIKFDCGYALHYALSEEEFNQGMESCLNNKEFYSFVTVYVVSDENAAAEELQKTVEEYCAKYNAHEQYMYFATAPQMDKAVITSHFEENADKFGTHMIECDLISEIGCTEMNRDEGIVERTVEKR